ncbi:M13 family metallopeptidase [Sphingomonas sp. URHD0057]|uniref:M13 family metallopeptidase n=1 Tax=Sphingomonas sp. URHD0057 TaxID=1380389 RepID=UPI00068605C3|nr:M13 family metallopeptidase [Sphingomonas sp. URHD0057]
MAQSSGIRFVRAAAVLLAASTVLAGAAIAQGASGAAPTVVSFGKWGVDLSARDTAVKPGDDFQRYTSGEWLDAHPIPADQSSNGTFFDTYNSNQDRLKDIIVGAAKDGQLGALYASYLDEPRLEQVDDAPLKADLARVEAIKDKADLTRFMGEASADFGASLFGAGVGPDSVNPNLNTLYLGSGGLGLPNRDYYLDDKYKKERDAYRAYVERALTMAGAADAAKQADAILAFETEVAKLTWPIADLRDIDKNNNPMTMAELAAYAPGFDWPSYFAASGIHTDKLIVGDNSAVKAKAALFAATPLDTLKAWERFNVTHQASNYLSKRFVDNRFEFTKVLSGVSQLRPRWRRGIDQVDGRLGELLGKTYIERYFSPTSKAMMEDLVGNLKKAAALHIKANSWMSDATKEAALVKLGKMDVMVGYPSKFRDYSKLAMKADDLYGNVKRSNVFEWQYQLSQLGQPVDRQKWALSPATVNAYNGGQENKIVFPAGILQAPFFDPSADLAVNYGAIGSGIGHEIMHGFDDQGRKIDQTGAIRDWWTAADANRFKALTTELGKQYSAFEAAPGVFVNGDLTMGENIGDMSGLEVAYDAYKMALNGKEAPVIDGLTGDQRFFLGFGQVWRANQRPDAVKAQVASNPHPPDRWRVIGAVRNMDAWYKAFNIGPDSKFYIPPEKRVRLW